MQYWYPLQERAAALDVQLSSLEGVARLQAADAERYLPNFSALLASASTTEGFPRRQLAQWIWIASLFRIHAASDSEIALVSGAALNFLQARIQGPIDDAGVQDLNWVLERTIERLSKIVEPRELRRCLSNAEINKLENQLASYDVERSFDVRKVRSDMAAQLAAFELLSKGQAFDGIKLKIDALFSAAVQNTAEAKVARAALLYLADENDVVCDSYGFLGLLDDIYVIEWAFAVVENQTRCLPLLKSFLLEFPFIGELAMVGNPSSVLDLYSQYVSGACLHSLFSRSAPSILVVREGGPYGVLCAFLAAVQAAKLQSTSAGEQSFFREIGQPVLIGDGTVTFKAVYLGRISVGGKERIKLGVYGAGSITIPLDVAPYMARAKGPHKQLSKGNDIAAWLKSRHHDPLVHLTGSSRHEAFEQECVLLVTPRNKIRDYFSSIVALDATPAALFGARYVANGHEPEDLKGSVSDAPYIYFCADADTAYDLIITPPPHVKKWRVIVDGARFAVALHASLTTDGSKELPSLCVIAELHERELSKELLLAGFSVLYLEDQDVEAPPLKVRQPSVSDNRLVRALNRRSNHWVVARELSQTRNLFLESVEEWLRKAAASNVEEWRAGMDMSVSAFLRQSLAWPFATPGSEIKLKEMGLNIAHNSQSLQHYSPLVAELSALFKPILQGAFPTVCRSESLRLLLSKIDPSESAVIICRSEASARIYQNDASLNPERRRITWSNLEGLRKRAPYDRAIVPGWLDRLSLREISNNGYASKLELLFLPFERRWFDSTISAGARWERILEERTRSSLEDIATRNPTLSSASLWSGQIKARLAASRISTELPPVSEEQTDPEFEALESRALEAISKSIVHNLEHRALAKARLTLFDNADSYIYLPPAGKVIVLSFGTQTSNANAQAKGQNAERMLFRSVESLEPGCLLAIPISSDRDLVDARADQYIENASAVRAAGALWKTALRKYFDTTREPLSTFANRMAEAGEPRDVTTIKYWSTGTRTVAPQNYIETIPLIARLIGDDELKRRAPQVIQAVDLIYRARTKAAEMIIQEIFSGQIDLTAKELVLQSNGSFIRYELHTVRRIDTAQDVPVDLIGRIQHIGPITAQTVKRDAVLGVIAVQ